MAGSENNNSAATPNSARQLEFFRFSANISAVVICAALIVLIIKATSYLPERYYFSLTSFVGGERASSFIINAPPLLTEAEICNIARARGVVLQQFCATEDELNKTLSELSRQKKADELTKPLTDQQPKKIETIDDISKKSAEELLREHLEKEIENREIRAIVSGAPQRQSIFALLLRCLIPIAVGGIIFLIYREQASTSVGLGAILAVFILFWPVVYLWDELGIADEWRDKFNLFFTMYVLYAILFFYLAKLGSNLAAAYLNFRQDSAVKVDKVKIVELIIASIIAGTIVQVLALHLIAKL